jgi:hypothetical protein
MEIIRKALQEAINDYNLWACKMKDSQYMNPSDYKGIFYNKLVTRLRFIATEAGLDIRKGMSNEFRIDDIKIIQFDQNWCIRRVEFKMDKGYFYGTRKTLLEALMAVSEKIELKVYFDKTIYELDDIINSINNFKI